MENPEGKKTGHGMAGRQTIKTGYMGWNLLTGPPIRFSICS